MAELEKTLSFPVIVLITINSIIGSGMFFLPAIGARVAGPASILSWVLLAFVSFYVALCFAELASLFPDTGGIYEFSKKAYGRFPSFLVGWVAWLVGNITTAMLVVAAIKYLIPQATGNVTLLGVSIPIFFVNVGFSIFWIVAFNYMAYKGMKTSAVMLVVFSFITLAVVLFAAIPSAFAFNISNLKPFFIKPTMMGNMAAIFVTIFIVSETFFGLESVLFLSGETKNPKKVIPKAMWVGMLIIIGITLFHVISSLGAVDIGIFTGIKQLSEPEAIKLFGKTVGAPYAYLTWNILGDWAYTVMTLGTYLIILGAAAGWVVTGPRLILTLAEDKLFPSQLSAIHPVNKTPHKAIMFQALASIVFIIIGSYGQGYETLLHILLPLVIVMLIVVLASMLVLRIKYPIEQREDAFIAPLGWPLTSIVILFHIALLAIWLIEESYALGTLRLASSFVLIGIPIYFMIEMFYDQKAIRIVTDFLAYLTLMTEFIFIPKRIVKEAMALLGDVRGKTVLEFGCSVGTITKELAKEVGPNGRLYASDISLRELRLTQMRLRNRKLENVRLIHDTEHATRVHPLIPKVDIVVSMGMLSYLQDVKKVLKELNSRLNEGGKFCFIDYGKFFYIIPNVEWMSNDEEIIGFFKDCGFAVRVLRKQSMFWDYVFVYGIKYGKTDAVYI